MQYKIELLCPFSRLAKLLRCFPCWPSFELDLAPECLIMMGEWTHAKADSVAGKFQNISASHVTLALLDHRKSRVIASQ
jgi:hypothetical protein